MHPQSPQPGAAAAPPRTGAPQAGVPTTASELTALTVQRGELQQQLRDLGTRRQELLEQRRVLDASAAPAHDQRISAIDARAARVEEQVMRLDALIAEGIARDASITGVPGMSPGGEAGALAPGMPGQLTTTEVELAERISREVNSAVQETLLTGGLVVVSLFVLLRGIRRLARRRREVLEDPQRLAQLQQSVDVIALEVERISESQRFVAAALNERLQVPNTARGGAKQSV